MRPTITQPPAKGAHRIRPVVAERGQDLVAHDVAQHAANTAVTVPIINTATIAGDCVIRRDLRAPGRRQPEAERVRPGILALGRREVARAHEQHRREAPGPAAPTASRRAAPRRRAGGRAGCRAAYRRRRPPRPATTTTPTASRPCARPRSGPDAAKAMVATASNTTRRQRPPGRIGRHRLQAPARLKPPRGAHHLPGGRAVFQVRVALGKPSSA